MTTCTVCDNLKIAPGSMADYKALAEYHYRSAKCGPTAAIFALKPHRPLPGLPTNQPVGVIVYSMPAPALELRNIATGNVFAGFDRRTQLDLVNANIRCISRVIIEPRFRSLGLAARLVRETMPLMNVPIVEALAIMGTVNPFFEKAGMTPYKAKPPVRCAELIEAFSVVGIEEKQLVDPEGVQRKLDARCWIGADFIEGRIRRFLMAYGRSRSNMPAGIERTRFVLSRLTERPVYYIWFNPNRKLQIAE
jgi:hypothetical protein